MNPEVRFAKSEKDEVSKRVKIESNTFYFTWRLPLKQQYSSKQSTHLATKIHCISRVYTWKMKKGSSAGRMTYGNYLKMDQLNQISNSYHEDGAHNPLYLG